MDFYHKFKEVVGLFPFEENKNWYFQTSIMEVLKLFEWKKKEKETSLAHS